MEYSIAKKKYLTIKQRSFDSYIELFLICSFINNKKLNSTSLEDFAKFSYSDTRISKALKAYQLSKNSDKFDGEPILILDKLITKWLAKNDLKSFKDFFYQHRLISKSDFLEFYGVDKSDRQCSYCKIWESEISLLIENDKLKTKRLSTRGQNMEIDRIEPNKGYENGNITLCCYWCNNAKTDEFDYEEFIPIGEQIGQALKARLE